MTDKNEASAITSEAGISAWVFLSRMHQLALELNTGMTHSRGPILRSMSVCGGFAESYGEQSNLLRIMGRIGGLVSVAPPVKEDV